MRALESTPGAAFGYVTISLANHELGNEEEAIDAYADMLEYVGGNPEGAAAIRSMYREMGYAPAQIAFAQQLEMLRGTVHIPPVLVGSLYYNAGDVENAIRWFRIAFEQGDPDAPYLGVNIKDPAIQSHPDFIALLRDIGLDYWGGRVHAPPCRRAELRFTRAQGLTGNLHRARHRSPRSSAFST